MRRLATFAALAGLVACATPTVEPYTFEPATEPVPLPRPEPEPEPTPTRTSTAPLALTVEQATLRALSRNRDLAVQRFGPVLAGTFGAIEEGVFDPEVFANLRLRRERASQVARATGERFDVSGTNLDAVAGLRQRLSTGTTLEATVEHGLDDSNRTPRQQVTRLGLTVTQSLLRGFGPAVNLAAVRQAEIELDASAHELTAFAESLALEAETAYWQLVLATEQLRIFRRAVAVAERQVADVEARIEVGQSPELDAAPVRAELSRRRQALIDAKSRREQARLRLARLVDSDPTLSTPVEAISDPRAPTPPVLDVDDRVRLALARRPDLLESRLRLEQNRLDVVRTRNGVLPQLDLFVALGKTGFDGNTGGTFRELGSETFDAVAGLDFSDFIGHRAVAAEDRAAHAARRQAKEAVENLRQLVALDVRLAAAELERARAQVAASARTAEHQAAVVEAERARFEVGAGTALLLATAQRDLLEAQIAEVRAVVDYRIAKIQLYRAEGSLLARRGVVIRAPAP